MTIEPFNCIFGSQNAEPKSYLFWAVRDNVSASTGDVTLIVRCQDIKVN